MDAAPSSPSLDCRTDATKASGGPICWCQVSEHGINFTVNEAKSLQASAYMKRGLFHEWQLAEAHYSTSEEHEPLQFGLNLSTLVECLRILGGGGSGATPLLPGPCPCLAGECMLHTMDVEPAEPILMDSHTPVRIVIKSDALHDGIAELEWGGDTGARAQKDKRLCLRVALDPPQLSLTAPGRRRRLSPHWTVAHPRPLRCEQVSSVDLGCEMAYPPESLVHFEAAEELEFDYRFSLVHLALRSIRESDETCLKIDSQGARPEEGFPSDMASCSNVFLEFYVFPLVDDEQVEAGG
ncbi:hypothetical protein EMIHUDRAFT_217010 [Emiliania huxleyi CCMP1516]|uniref:Uncharacterized protein n=2 Tax=Emiliania huxleyi TaxID=2903 RepID=A0A0D3IBY2_EMIH1|nr:hypothetical protein EMIHUDRAFT_217010 [Emiliania huxleyi CCMP1516]EOD08767.1 hypothetical protein EMIHUDRAFT_217010 [Emiliania huxleyi CCMP1516]|eukprot:XP_005761196.1 hypothetical protein EMIHUDRAFT_217010 [Emiliania huxleyi CCMP1516]